jgi:C-terminal processing protease CtpA/Prc
VRYVAPESDAERQGMHAGDQVLAVNGFAPTRESLWQINYLFHLLRPQRALHTTLRAPGGSPREIDIASTVRERTKIVDLSGADGGRDIGRLIRDGEKHLDDYRAETIEYGDRVLVWKMPTFVIPLDDVRDALRRARRQKALVLDLRGNGGGYVAVMLELVKQLSRDSVIVGSLHERRKTTPMVAKGGRDDAFVGDVYVLVDSRSASASEILARTVQLTKRGTVIGDRTAGAVMQAESRFSTLGIETRILYGAQVTNADIIMSDGARLEHVGVTPDELLLPSSTDLAAGRDVVLARALTLAGVPTDPTKAGQLYSRSSR